MLRMLRVVKVNTGEYGMLLYLGLEELTHQVWAVSPQYRGATDFKICSILRNRQQVPEASHLLD